MATEDVSPTSLEATDGSGKPRTGTEHMDWWVSIPKVELHAHLNGSIRNSTLLELARELGEKGTIVFSDFKNAILKRDRSLHEVFKLFDLIHLLVTDHKTVTRIAKEVIEDFAAENVVYLELRTTPKRNDLTGMTKRSYMEAVVEGIRAVTSVDVDFVSDDEFGSAGPTNRQIVNGTSNGIERKKIHARLLLSIDRRETTEAAMETVGLALEMRHWGVVGIDLSGNPIVGQHFYQLWYMQRSKVFLSLFTVARYPIRRRSKRCWTFVLEELAMLVALKRNNGKS